QRRTAGSKLQARGSCTSPSRRPSDASHWFVTAFSIRGSLSSGIGAAATARESQLKPIMNSVQWKAGAPWWLLSAQVASTQSALPGRRDHKRDVFGSIEVNVMSRTCNRVDGHFQMREAGAQVSLM